jgi:MFS transporter, DHA1 family, multidrug resistance protein
MRFYAVVFLEIVTDTSLYLIIPLYAHSLGASQIEVGLIGAVFWAAQIPFQPLFGRFSSIRTQRILLLVGMGGNGLLILFFPLSRDLSGLILIRFLQGIFGSAFWVATRYVAAEEAPRSRVGAVMGLYGVSMGFAGMLGPFLAGYVIDGYGFISAFFTALTFAILALLPMSIGWRPRGKPEGDEIRADSQSEKTFPEDRGKETRILLIACLPLFIWGLGAGIANSIFPVYLSILSFASTDIGIILMIRSVSLLISQWLGGRLSDRFNRNMLATLGVTLSITIGAIPLVNSFAGFALVLFASSFGVGVSYSVGLTLISDLSRKRKGIGFGLFGSASTAGMAIGSQVGGAIAQYTVLTAPYYFASAVTTLVALLLYYLYRKSN